MWRKALQICKRIFSLVLLLSFTSFVFSQDFEMPEMPEMPSISLDGSFYKPTFHIPSTPTPPTPPKEVEGEEKTVITSTPSKENDVITSIMNQSQTLTANDISNLYDYGLFNDVNTLFGMSGTNMNSNNTSTTILLEEILKQLNELKVQEQNASKHEKEVNSNTKKDNDNFKERNPSILRFKINDYDITESLEKVFLSKPSEDGSFLLTADRRYVADRKNRSETFYLLFSPVKEAGSNVSYTVEGTISQDWENPNSFIYKLCNVENLTAQKTGNLVVIKYSDKDLKVDLLLDIDRR